MDKFEKFNLKISKKEKEIVLEYLEKVKKFTKENWIDEDLYNDIEEMVFEKLSLEKELNQLNVIRVAKEVWEPEVIFSDYFNEEEKSKKSKDKNKKDLFYKKLIEENWVRDNSWAILLWISKTLAEKIGTNVWIIRILLLILFIPVWVSWFLYLVVWIILPVKWIEYKSKNDMIYIKTQIILVIKDLIKNFSWFIINIIKFIILNLISFMKHVFNFIINNIFPIIRFFIFGFLSFIFACILVCLLAMWAFYYSDFSIGNIDFVWVLPWYFIWWVVFWAVTASILTVWAFLYGIRRKVLNSYVFSLAGISFVIALFLWISTGFDLAKKYIWESKITQNAEIKISDTWTWVINLNISWSFENGFIWNMWRITWVNIKASTWSEIKAEVVKTIYWNENIREKIENWLNNIMLEKVWNEIILKSENNEYFNKKTPFTFFHNDLNLYLPTNKKYYINWSYYYFENVHTANNYWEYNSYLNSNCTYKNIYYSKDEEKFVCEPSEEDLKYAKLEYLKYEVIEKFDKISTIKHVDKYKREYYGNYWVKSDWSFDNLYFWNDDKILNIEFSDNSLDIDAKINYEETSTWVVFNSFEIEDIEAWYSFKEKYYEDITPIKDFLNEEEFGKEINNEN